MTVLNNVCPKGTQTQNIAGSDALGSSPDQDSQSMVAPKFTLQRITDKTARPPQITKTSMQF